MGFRLLARTMARVRLSVEGREVQILSLDIPTSPCVLLDERFFGGWRPADENELKAFAKKYKPASWYPRIHAINPNSAKSPFGPVARVFSITGGDNIEQVDYNPIRGLPEKTLILFIKKSPG